MNSMYSDMARNYPNIFAQQWKGYQEDRNSDWNRPPLTPENYFRTRRKVTPTTAKSARRSASIKKRHLIERYADYGEMPIFPHNDKPLVLYFYGTENFGYIANTNAGYFVVDFVEHGDHDLDYAECVFKHHDGKVMLRVRAKTLKGAVAKICGQKWAVFTAWNRAYNLYSFYKAIHFWFEDKPESHKQPRNNRRVIKTPKNYRKLF